MEELSVDTTEFTFDAPSLVLLVVEGVAKESCLLVLSLYSCKLILRLGGGSGGGGGGGDSGSEDVFPSDLSMYVEFESKNPSSEAVP